MFYKFFCLRFCVSSDSEKTECNKDFTRNRSNRPKVICKKGVLRNFAKFTEKYLCHSLFFNKVADTAYNFIKKVILAQVFCREFFEIFKNTCGRLLLNDLQSTSTAFLLSSIYCSFTALIGLVPKSVL